MECPEGDSLKKKFTCNHLLQLDVLCVNCHLKSYPSTEMYDVHVNIICIQGYHLYIGIFSTLIAMLLNMQPHRRVRISLRVGAFSLCTVTPFTEKNLGGRCL